MPSDIPANVSYLGGVWCAAVLYGVHLVIFGVICSVFLGKWHTVGRGFSATTLLATSFCMFALSTAHVGLSLHSLLQGFIHQASEPSDVYFRNNVFPNRKAVYIINTLLGDALLIWRVCVIWQRKFSICVLPILLLLGTTICGIKTIAANARASHSSVFDYSILSWVTSMFVLNIAAQLTATVLISYRIYRAYGLSKPGSRNRSRYLSLVWLVVESGAIYTSAALIQLITYLLNMNAGVIMEFILAQICAIAPALIIIRVALGSAYENGDTAQDVVLTTFHDTLDTSRGTGYTEHDKGGFDTTKSDTLGHEAMSEEPRLRYPRPSLQASETS